MEGTRVLHGLRTSSINTEATASLRLLSWTLEIEIVRMVLFKYSRKIDFEFTNPKLRMSAKP
jgi:hypothetical protein